MIQAPPSSYSDGEVRIREVTLDAAEDLYRWRMAPRIKHNFWSTKPVTYEDHLRFLRNYFQLDNTDCWFAIEVDREQVGTLSLYDVSANGEAEMGRLSLNPERRLRWGHDRRLSVRAGIVRAVDLLKTFSRAHNICRWRVVTLATNSPLSKLAHDIELILDEKVEIDGREFINWQVVLCANDKS